MGEKYKLEYVWLDGYLPEPNLRSKTKIVDKEPKSAADCPIVGLRRQFDPAGRRTQLGLHAASRSPCTRTAPAGTASW